MKRDIPELPGYVSLQHAADRIGVSRQYAHDMAENGDFETVYKVMCGGKRPTAYLITEAEVRAKEEALAARRARVAATAAVPAGAVEASAA